MRGEPSSPTLQQENVLLVAQAQDQDLSVCSMFASAALPQRQGRHCLIGSTAARRRCFCVTFFREIKSFKSFKDKHIKLKVACKRTAVHGATMHTACVARTHRLIPMLWYTPWHALEHTRTFRHKYDLPLHTTNRTQNQFRAGRCGQATGASTALEHLAVVTTILRLLL